MQLNSIWTSIISAMEVMFPITIPRAFYVNLRSLRIHHNSEALRGFHKRGDARIHTGIWSKTNTDCILQDPENVKASSRGNDFFCSLTTLALRLNTLLRLISKVLLISKGGKNYACLCHLVLFGGLIRTQNSLLFIIDFFVFLCFCVFVTESIDRQTTV